MKSARKVKIGQNKLKNGLVFTTGRRGFNGKMLLLGRAGMVEQSGKGKFLC